MSESLPTIEQCPNCGYSLRGLPELRCPECGVSIDPDEVAAAALPWERERTVGAFWRTVKRVQTQPGTLRYLPPDDKRARQFGRWCLLVAGLLCALPTVLFADMMMKDGRWRDWLPEISIWFDEPIPWWHDMVMPWLAGAWFRPVFPLAMFFGVWLAGWALRYAVSRRLRFASSASSDPVAHYLLAGTIGWSFAFVVAGTGVTLGWLGEDVWLAEREWLPAIIPVWLILWTIIFVAIATRGSLLHGSAVLFAPVSVLIAFVVGLAVVPWVCGLLAIMWESLR
ncbi:MAG: hypothetical protein AAF656_05430 [Planctomycetota bacterium]